MKGGYQILDFGGMLTARNSNMYRQPQQTPGMYEKAEEAIKSGKMILITGFKDVNATFPGSLIGTGTTQTGHKYISLMYYMYLLEIDDNGLSTIFPQ